MKNTAMGHHTVRKHLSGPTSANGTESDERTFVWPDDIRPFPAEVEEALIIKDICTLNCSW